MAKETLSTGELPLGGSPRNSEVMITDRPDMTSAVYRGCSATNQTDKSNLRASGANFSPENGQIYSLKNFSRLHRPDNKLHMRIRSGCNGKPI